MLSALPLGNLNETAWRPATTPTRRTHGCRVLEPWGLKYAFGDENQSILLLEH